jgi:uncharacterized Rossmann fold enzyme
MNLKEWQPWYDKIIETFGYDAEKDQYAAEVLSGLLEGIAVTRFQLKWKIYSKPTLVFGAGPSLEEDIKKLLTKRALDKFVLIAADGATTALLKIANTVPDIIVTDLDGRSYDLFRANIAGATMVVHGHGDNIKLLQKFVPKFRKKIGTTQTIPRPNVYNFGGFTDGDRAIFLSSEMEAKIIVLAGMDFGQSIGKYSKRKVKSLEVKKLKLKIGKELLEWLSTKIHIPLYNITSHGEKITGFDNIAIEDVLKLV